MRNTPSPDPRPRVLFAVDRRGWAFDNIARAVHQHGAGEFRFNVAPYPRLAVGEHQDLAQPDVLVSFWWGSADLVAAQVQPRRHVVCLFDGYSVAAPGGAANFARVLRGADLVVVANDAFARFVPPGIPVAVCPDGVDLELFAPQGSPPAGGRFCAAWTGNSGGAASAGGSRDLKGLGLIREACARAKVPLTVRDAAQGVVFSHAEMPAWYAQASVYVCASECEGTPNPVLEAMACGRPVVSTAVGLVPGLAGERSGIVVVERSVEAITRALRELRELPAETLAGMGLDARARIAQGGSWGTRARAWLDALRGVAERPSRGVRGRLVPAAMEPPAPAAMEPPAPAARPDWSARVTAFLVSSGEPSTEEALARLEAQSVQVRVERIANVAPMDRAFQAMLDRCTTELFVQVDADMMLEPGAVEALVRGLDAQPPAVAMFVGWLWGDAEERPIQGVKVYRHATVQRFPYAPSLSCEVPQLEALRAAGHPTVSAPLPTGPGARAECLGLHFSLQSPEVAFHRWQRLAAKYRARPYMGWLSDRFGVLRRRFLEYATVGDPRADVYEAAWLGAVAGLTAEGTPDREADASAPRDAWRRTLPIVGDWSSGPREISLYVTQRCNARCTFCRRAFDPGLDGPGEMNATVAGMILDAFPSVRSVCLAGFGEPTLNPELPAIVRECRRRGLYVGAITNGLLLEDRARELVAAGVRRVTVSVNAATRERYAATHGLDGWDAVLRGVRAMVAAGKPVGVETGASFVVHRENAHLVPTMLALAADLGVDTVDLPNLLPHAGPDARGFRERVLRVDSPELRGLEELRASGAPGVGLVGHWPVPIDPEGLRGECPRRCDSPFMSLGVDTQGMVTGCRRVAPPAREHGHFSNPRLWHGPHHRELRAAQTGDRPLPDACRWCFASWSR